MISIAHKMEKTISLWRMIGIDELKRLFIDVYGIRRNYFWIVLNRLNKSSKIFQFRKKHDHLVFHHSWKSRWEYLHKSKAEDHQVPLQRAGFNHHLELVRTGIRLQEQYSHLEVRPVFNIDPSMRRETAYGVSELYSPDLVCVNKDTPDELIYLEYESSLKTPARYWHRWNSYEADPAISLCLYLVSSAELEGRLSHHLREYFRRTYSSTSYQMAIVQQDIFFEGGECRVFSPGNEEKCRSTEIFKKKRMIGSCKRSKLETLNLGGSALIPPGVKTTPHPQPSQNVRLRCTGGGESSLLGWASGREGVL